jgi:protein-L-isoaspartate(D-aspartate) O-methyltransferase
MTFEKARIAMVESQLRPNGVRDTRILNAFATLPRECFVQSQQQALAYMDDALPVAAAAAGVPARSLLPPMVLARLLQFAAPLPKDRVLDIGGATGYSAAILARLCENVIALEDRKEIAEEMKRCLELAKVSGVAIQIGPLNEGFAASKPYDLIVIAGAVAAEPKGLFDQLSESGRLVTVIRQGWFGQAYLFSKNEGAISGRAIFDAGADILPGFEEKPEFVF